MDKNTWFSTEQAAKYLGISKTNLYNLSQEGKVPVSKLGKKWVYEKNMLDEWIRGNKSIDNFFVDINFDIENNEALREPQKEGYSALYNFFKKGGKKAIVQIPVGCGKSGLACLIPLGVAKGRILVIAPNLTIKDELYQNMDITNRQKCFWRKARILKEENMIAGPYATTLDQGNISISEKSHIVITNIQQLSTNTEKWLSNFKDDFFDLIIVDEGHHSAAQSWNKVFNKFQNAKIVNLTATPFRSDRKSIDGELVYRYPFKSASIKGYIKKIKASYVAPEELTFTAKGETKTYTLKEVLEMKNEIWFSRGIAMSELCNISIVDNSLEKLEQLRQSGTKHQLIAVACSIRHAQMVRSLYSERGYNAEVIHSKLSEDKKEEVIRDLKNGLLDCIIQVQMLGEGFDHPKLSVAAIFNPFRSLAPYIQFVGRILRVIVQNDPIHPDNYGHIVTHVGLNLDEQLKLFKDFENDDKLFWEKVTGGDDPETSRKVLSGDTKKRFGEIMTVDNEIIDSLIEEDFTSIEDHEIIAELENKFKNLGIDPSLAKEVFEKSKSEKEIIGIAKPAEAFSVQPQRQWAESKKRLNEEVKRTAKILLNNCDLKIEGREIPYKYRIGVSSRNNLVAGIELINKRVNNFIGNDKNRENWTNEELVNAQKELENILKSLIRLIKKIQYDQKNKGTSSNID